MSEPLEILFRVCPSLLAVVHDGRFVRVNDAWTTVLGWSAEELCARPAFELLHPEDVLGSEVLREELVSGRCTSAEREVRFRTRDGGHRRVQLQVRVEDGHLYVHGSDVTERRALEEELRRETELLVESQSIGAIGSWSFDPIASRIRWTDEAFRLFGLEPRPEAPSYEEHLTQIHPDDVGHWRANVEGAMASGNDYAFEYRALLPDGTTRDLIGRGRCRKDASGRVVWMSGTVQDISERKASERELLATRETALAASRAKSTFLATMSHEIRTPLFGIQGTAALLAESALDKEQRELVGTLRTSAEALLGIINDVLDYSKVEAGKMTLDLRTFEVRALLDGALDIVRPLAREKGLCLLTEIDPGVPLELAGDDGRIRQVLLNLLSNAVKFTPVGSVTLRVRCEPESGSERIRLVAAVEDTGIGLAPADLARLFTDFSQVDGTTTRRFQGTGLGLAISRRLAERMGGSVAATSEPGRGSIFTARFLLACVGLRSSSVLPRLPSFVPSTRKLRILLAEDNAVNQMLVRRHVQKHGHEVVVVGNGLDAFARAEAGGIDVILMDCHMPELDGYEATRRIRALGGRRGAVPILALTASVLEDDRRACADAGMDGFLTKPISDRELATAISNVARGEESRARCCALSSSRPRARA
jgi:PAS domain S-box-containing protein